MIPYNLQATFKDYELLKKTKKLYRDNNIWWTFDADHIPDISRNRTNQYTFAVLGPTPGRHPNAIGFMMMA
jgi:hypothetical protein